MIFGREQERVIRIILVVAVVVCRRFEIAKQFACLVVDGLGITLMCPIAFSSDFGTTRRALGQLTDSVQVVKAIEIDPPGSIRVQIRRLRVRASIAREERFANSVLSAS